MPIKMKVQDFMDATLVMSQIIREDRRLPTKGKFLLGRMHAVMQPEFIRINAERDAIIKSYGFKMEVPNPEFNPSANATRERLMQAGRMQEALKIKVVTQTIETDAVPEDQGADFETKWGAIADAEIELAVDAIHIDDLCYPGDLEDGSITAHEFIKLGDLIVE